MYISLNIVVEHMGGRSIELFSIQVYNRFTHYSIQIPCKHMAP